MTADTYAVLITTALLALVMTGFVLGIVPLRTALIMWLTHAVMVPVLILQGYEKLSISFQVAAFSLFLVAACEAVTYRFSQAKKSNRHEDWRP